MLSHIKLFLLRFKTIGAFTLYTFCTIFVLHYVTSLSFFIQYADYDSWEYAVGEDNIAYAIACLHSLFVGNTTKVPYLLYLRNAYLLTASVTTTGYGDITVTHMAEALYISIILILSKLFYSFLVGYYSILLSVNAVQQVKARKDFESLKVCIIT